MSILSRIFGKRKGKFIRTHVLSQPASSGGCQTDLKATKNNGNGKMNYLNLRHIVGEGKRGKTDGIPK